MTKLVFRTSNGVATIDRRGLEAAKELMPLHQCTCGKDDEAVKAMSAHRFLPSQEQDKLERARERAGKPAPRIAQRILNSSADRVEVQDFGTVAAFRAKGGK